MKIKLLLEFDIDDTLGSKPVLSKEKIGEIILDNYLRYCNHVVELHCTSSSFYINHVNSLIID